MSLVIREYRPEDEAEWMRVHAVIMTISHAWNYCIQERPAYAGHESTRLVAELDGKIIALTDAQYENEPGELCLVHEPKSGYVLEFGRLPEYAGLNIGKLLIDATVEDARKRGYQRLEYWSQDRAAQRFYRRLKLEEIGRHYRFRFRPPKSVADLLLAQRVGIEYCYGVCLPEDWPLVQKDYDVITRHPLEPHLCVGFQIRTGL
jgi:ribosomal protein S18 acetylase RimI-like enzyme